MFEKASNAKFFCHSPSHKNMSRDQINIFLLKKRKFKTVVKP